MNGSACAPRRVLAFSVIIFLCLAGGVDAQVEIANSVSDFSGVQGQNGWRYGQYAAFDHAGFTQLSTYNGSYWEDTQAFSTPWVLATGGHPGVTDLSWSVRRWTAGISGDIRITGSFYSGDIWCGDGTHVRILHNGTEVYQYLDINTETPVPYAVELAITAGDMIDFAIDPITDGGCDRTEFTASIMLYVEVSGETSTWGAVKSIMDLDE